jgi:hypothetical protein
VPAGATARDGRSSRRRRRGRQHAWPERSASSSGLARGCAGPATYRTPVARLLASGVATRHSPRLGHTHSWGGQYASENTFSITAVYQSIMNTALQKGGAFCDDAQLGVAPGRCGRRFGRDRLADVRPRAMARAPGARTRRYSRRVRIGAETAARTDHPVDDGVAGRRGSWTPGFRFRAARASPA